MTAGVVGGRPWRWRCTREGGAGEVYGWGPAGREGGAAGAQGMGAAGGEVGQRSGGGGGEGRKKKEKEAESERGGNLTESNNHEISRSTQETKTSP